MSVMQRSNGSVFLRAAILCLSTSCISTAVNAQTWSTATNAYFGLIGGAQLFDGGEGFVDYDPGYVIGGQLGYKLGELRAEAEIAYESAEFEDGVGTVFDITVLRGSLGAYYDFSQPDILGDLSPYLGGGIGLADLTIEGTDGNTFEDDETALTLHGELGMSLNLAYNFSIAPHYRIEWYDSGNIAGFGDDIIAHNFRIAGRLWF